MTTTNASQDNVIEKLSRKGFYVSGRTQDETGTTFFLTKEVRHGRRYAEVDPDGLVNGEALPAFLEWLR